MENNNTITFSRLVELSERYSVKQIAVIYDPDFDAANKQLIVSTYKKADSLNDYEVINLLHQKFDMMSLLNFDTSGLPESTMEEANQSFEDIYHFINEVVPKSQLQNSKGRWRSRKVLNGKRRYGGKSFVGCFEIKSNGNVIFHARKYLFRTSGENVRTIAKNLGYPKGKNYDSVISILIDWICEQPNMKDEVIEILLKMTDEYPIPIEDISDMMCGKIQVTI